jgi:hypothetical protein
MDMYVGWVDATNNKATVKDMYSNSQAPGRDDVVNDVDQKDVQGQCVLRALLFC